MSDKLMLKGALIILFVLSPAHHLDMFIDTQLEVKNQLRIMFGCSVLISLMLEEIA